MAPLDTDALVAALRHARDGGPRVDDTAWQPHVTTLEQAYAVQERLFAALDPAAVARHWKSGAASTGEPSRHAPLPSAGVHTAGADLRDLSPEPGWVEAEVALRIGRAVGPDEARSLGPDTAPALVDGLCVSIEVLGSRWAGGRGAPPLLKLADLLMHAALVVGEIVPFAPRDWASQACRVRIGDGEGQSFTGSLGIGDPAWVLVDWLRHATRQGAVVEAGTVVSTGSWCGMLPVRRGDRVAVEFPGLGAAQVQL
ncbi:fumarylacetoacetate hydrolase family protein [Aquabacterium sp. J223]|uniref:fumarylacetoacetate hydrolase family protein n=1 Tax=Aquabacterium sp. J223 TaxID=2898431 RepID=UPI0021ADF7A7|nr:fumarylacetoacetate hydrolase family protein [Aquabacterium sp. J223]UUX96696.1 fumarylacetoacetate hydrolase family protein [Aquabacterium sp. J223]